MPSSRLVGGLDFDECPRCDRPFTGSARAFYELMGPATVGRDEISRIDAAIDAEVRRL